MVEFDELERKFLSFDHLVRDDLMPLLEKCEADYRYWEKRRARDVVIAVLLALIILVAVSFSGYLNALITGVVLGLFLIGYVLVIFKHDHARTTKKTIMRFVCGYLGVKFGGRSTVRVADFQHLGLIPFADRWRAEDAVSGEIEGTRINLVEVTLWDEEDRFESERFHGILMVVPISKRFEGTTFIMSRGLETAINFGRFGPGERVKLESLEFERRYNVYSSDQVTGRYLVTPLFMERFLQLRKVMAIRAVRAVFREGKLFLALETSQRHFEIDMDRDRIADVQLVRRLTGELCRLFRVVQLVTHLTDEPVALSKGALKL